MISYADLEKAFRQERAAPTLQKLSLDFYKEANALAGNPEVGDFRESISQYLEKVYYLRANKVVHYAGRAIPGMKPPENILPVELTLYNSLVEAVARHKATIFETKLDVPIQKAQLSVKVRILQALPTIVGSDSKEYGPFKEDDVVELPEDSAALLLERKIVEKFG